MFDSGSGHINSKRFKGGFTYTLLFYVLGGCVRGWDGGGGPGGLNGVSRPVFHR